MSKPFSISTNFIQKTFVFFFQPSIEELETYLTTEDNPTANLLNHLKDVPLKICALLKKKLTEKWDVNLNIKIPYFVIPEVSSYLK